MKKTYNDFYELALEIKRWHTKTFRASIESQFLKVEEELEEFDRHPCMEEYADCFIAISALSFRFESRLAKLIWKEMVNNILELPNCDSYYQGIVDKFEIDKVRRFERIGKVHRHIEEK